MKIIQKIGRSEDGATAIEYSLIAALIALAAIVAMGNLGNTLKNSFSKADTSMKVNGIT